MDAQSTLATKNRIFQRGVSWKFKDTLRTSIRDTVALRRLTFRPRYWLISYRYFLSCEFRIFFHFYSSILILCFIVFFIMSLFPLQMTSRVFSVDGEPLVLFFSKESQFSNFFPCNFNDVDSGLRFSCSEQMYMWVGWGSIIIHLCISRFTKAMHFGDSNSAERIIRTRSQKELKTIGRWVQGFNQKQLVPTVRLNINQVLQVG